MKEILYTKETIKKIVSYAITLDRRMSADGVPQFEVARVCDMVMNASYKISDVFKNEGIVSEVEECSLVKSLKEIAINKRIFFNSKDNEVYIKVGNPRVFTKTEFPFEDFIKQLPVKYYKDTEK